MREPLEIEIMGQRLVVKSEDSEEHVRTVARYVDEQIRQLADTRFACRLDLALVTALNIASEYWKLQHQQEEAHQTIDRMAQRIGACLHR
ncbi:MAG: cell division protein ZapA [Candidatus Binatia bacterium]|jgi:cell division protein ZapA (FtsZ GTPase activity inhibitor)